MAVSNEEKRKIAKHKAQQLGLGTRPAIDKLSDIHKDAIFHHEDCKKIFNEAIEKSEMPVTESTAIVIRTFAQIMPEITDKQINLSDREGEYETLVNLIDGHFDETYPANPGYFILMARIISATPGKYYDAMSAKERLTVATACASVLKESKAIETPIREAAIRQFYEVATQDQLDDIRMVVKQHFQRLRPALSRHDL